MPATTLPTAELSKRLASFKLKDAVIKDLAKRFAIDGLKIGRIDPCMYGICIDYTTDKAPDLAHMLDRKGIARIDVFPYGIIDWDRFHVRVAYQIDQLAGRTGVAYNG